MSDDGCPRGERCARRRRRSSHSCSSGSCGGHVALVLLGPVLLVDCDVPDGVRKEPQGGAGASARVGGEENRRDDGSRSRSSDTDGSYRPHPFMPSAAKLDYVHKAGSATLIVGILIVLAVYVALRPRRALALLEGRGIGGLP